MLKHEIKEGGRYEAKVNGTLTVVRVDRIVDDPGNSRTKASTRYYVTNERTGRKTTFRSAAKFRKTAPALSGGKGGLVKEEVEAVVQCDNCGAVIAGEVQDVPALCQDCGRAREASEEADPTSARIVDTKTDTPSTVLSPPTEGDRLTTSFGTGTVIGPSDEEGFVWIQLDEPYEGEWLMEYELLPHELKGASDATEAPEEPQPREERLGGGEPTVQPGEAEEPQCDCGGHADHEPWCAWWSTQTAKPAAQGPEHGEELEEYPFGKPAALVGWDPQLPPAQPTATAPNVGSIVRRKLEQMKETPEERLVREVGEHEAKAGITLVDLANKLRAKLEPQGDKTVLVDIDFKGAELKPPMLSQSHNAFLQKSVGRADCHVIVRARAGTGKTTTLVEGMKRAMGLGSDLTPSDQQALVWEAMEQSRGVKSVGFCAFNSSIAEELKRRVPQGADATTMHSMGYKAVRRAFGLSGNDVVNRYRVSEIAGRLLGRDWKEVQKERVGWLGVGGVLAAIIKFCKMRLVGVDERNRFDSAAVDWGREIDQIVNHYDIDLSDRDAEDTYRMVPQILEACLDPTQDGCIDFDDQIWLAVVSPGVRLWQYDLLCVDEAQDLNPAQQRLVQKAGRRLVVCGDDRQAIYGFTGADTDGLPTMERVLSETSRGCDLLPLTVTRRCGRLIVEEAKELVPDFEAHESNGEGFVGEARYPIQRTDNYWTGGGKERKLPWDQTYLRDVEPGDLVLCRVNAHLVLQCTEHHKRGNRAFILGREYGDQYRAFVEQFGAADLKDLIAQVSDWRVRETEKEQAKRRPSESKLMHIEGKADTILAISEGQFSVEDVLNRLDDLFVKDANRPGILHSSIHKAKGLEANNVFFLQPKGGQCPHPMAKTPWAQEQELNLKYVGITRAISNLTWVY